MAPKASLPITASYPSSHLTIGCGAAIFHLASSRVILCYHSRDNYYFLPKGRKNANETHTAAAEREGFEETGYRNRLLPLPLVHRQTQPDDGHGFVEFVSEAIWVQLLPLPAQGVQYILYWYAAETVPPDVEEAYVVANEGSEVAGGVGRVYRSPPGFPADITINKRMKQDIMSTGASGKEIYEPVWHEGTGVDEVLWYPLTRHCESSEALSWRTWCVELGKLFSSEYRSKHHDNLGLGVDLYIRDSIYAF
jgi:8-oxo-dGTP pyrophosphatase MutT (NUDIX family)